MQIIDFIWVSTSVQLDYPTVTDERLHGEFPNAWRELEQTG
jgi:hypothetical protein